MRRRDFVKGIVAVPIAAQTLLGQQTAAPTQTQVPAPTQAPATTSLVPPPAQLGRRGMGDFKAPPITTVVPDAIAAPEVRFFTETQLATLRRLSDLLMPPLDDYPGALVAEAAEFLDFLVGASPVDRQLLFRSGLDHLNVEARKQFGKTFAELDAAQADKIVRPGLATWMSDHPPTEPFQHFMALAHEDIRMATMNSAAWSVAALAAGDRAPGVGLYWSPIDPDLKNRA